MFSKIKELFIHYERYILPVSFLAGFIWDNLTLRRIDLWLENILFAAHIFIVLAVILMLNVYEGGRFRRWALEKYLPLFMQFSFGALFSGFFVFYSRSGSPATSWPFLLFLGLLLIGNEMFRKHYLRLTFQLNIFFIILFSYAVFLLPVVMGRMGKIIFLLSGLASMALMGLIIFILFRLSPLQFKKSKQALFPSIAAIYFIFNLFYFTNVLPPMPLSLKEIGLYHSAEKSGEQYLLTYEPAQWYPFFSKESGVFRRADNASVYVYSAVFAPTKLHTAILHEWSYYDENKREWIKTDQILFPISGGRDGGYRGYSLKQGVMPGKWRVGVITERDQLIGRIKFRVIKSDKLPNLETVVR